MKNIKNILSDAPRREKIRKTKTQGNDALRFLMGKISLNRKFSK